MEITSIDQLVDMKIVEFGQNCSDFDVNKLTTLKQMLNMALGEIKYNLNEILQFRYTNINMTEDEYKQFASQVASMGGLISNINSKIEIVDYYFVELTPACFK